MRSGALPVLRRYNASEQRLVFPVSLPWSGWSAAQRCQNPSRCFGPSVRLEEAGRTSAIAGRWFRAAAGVGLHSGQRPHHCSLSHTVDRCLACQEGRVRPAPPGVSSEGAQLVKCPPKMSELPVVLPVGRDAALQVPGRSAWAIGGGARLSRPTRKCAAWQADGLRRPPSPGW
jgi:hypothetical protein